MAEVLAAPAAPVAPVAPPVAPAPVVDTTPPAAAVTPPAASVVETPAATPPVAPVATPTPTVSPEMQAYISGLERQAQDAQRQADAAVLQDTVARYAAKLEAEQGLTPEQAKFIATREGQQAYEAYQADQFRRGQVNAALEIGQRYGVDPRRLLNLPTPEAMTQAALAATAQTRESVRLAALEKENAELKKKLAPPQTFASGAVSGDGTTVTKENVDALYMKDPDRYGAVYSRFLKTGQLS